jgi:hypothetical protein
LGACQKSFKPKSRFRTKKIITDLEQISDFACGIVSSIWQKSLTGKTAKLKSNHLCPTYPHSFSLGVSFERFNY